jgi:broad specificity phosphatase PhoE
VDGVEPTRVTVLRHGEVAGRAHVYRGALDEPMTVRGSARLRELAERLAAPAFDRIASSPLDRCLAFARAYAEERHVRLDVVSGLGEMHFGVWEGLTPEEAAGRDPEGYRRFRESAGESAPEGGESISVFHARVRDGWESWLADARGGHRLLLTHAGVMRALLMELVGLPAARVYRVALPEAAHFQVSILPGEAPILLNLNPCAG